MNFFKAQDQARKSTTRLILLFALAVICLILLTNLAIMLALEHENLHYLLDSPRYALELFDTTTFWWVTLGVSCVILAASLIKLSQLSHGGHVVAESLGGRAIPFNSEDPLDKKILNIVEEMAIAAGSHVPVVYLIDETSINAFAAGWNSNDAVIGVTKGAVEKLNRDELQGVVAHEFSHILNGDMRLNIQLIGVLYGIEVIGLFGRNFLRIFSGGRRRHSGGYSYSHSSSRNNSSGGSGGGVIILLALALMVIGYIGTLFGNMIKAAISRHREYLADASAVQYTRNPDSIGNALRKIGGDVSGSLLHASNVSEFSHLYFASGLKQSWFSAFATHPPLDERIQRINPQWDGSYLEPPRPDLTPEAIAEKANAHQKKVAATIATTAAVITTMDAMNGIDSLPTEKHISRAHQLLNEIPEAIHQQLKDPYGARAVTYLLLLAHDKETLKKQLFHLRKHADPDVYQLVRQLYPEAKTLTANLRLPIVDIAIATLRKLSLKQYKLFRANSLVLMKADQKIDTTEWMLQRILFHHLDEAFSLRKRAPARHAFIGAVKGPCEVMLSRIAHIEHSDEQEAEAAFVAGRAAIGAGALRSLPRDQITVDDLDSAMDELVMLKPLLKQRFLKACATTLTHNDQVTIEGVELLRTLASSLDTPMPPILPVS